LNRIIQDSSAVVLFIKDISVSIVQLKNSIFPVMWYLMEMFFLLLSSPYNHQLCLQQLSHYQFLYLIQILPLLLQYEIQLTYQVKVQYLIQQNLMWLQLQISLNLPRAHHMTTNSTICYYKAKTIH
jgi:hypothetical protein